MSDVAPFQGTRYNPEKVPDLSKVVAPPYDVIDEAHRARLAVSDEHNVVRLILPTDEPGMDRYTHAAELLRRWLSDRVLLRDPAPGIYVVRQEWTSGLESIERTGFIAAVRLEPFGVGHIYPHENTLSAPKEDRLALLKTTRANLSQVLALFPDEQKDVDSWLSRVIASPPLAQATDDAGVVTRLWRECRDRRIAQLTEFLAERPLFIADGHHRYETALAYQRFCAENSGPLAPNAPENSVMMLCVAINNSGLVTLPTHRLLPGDTVSPDTLIPRLSKDFDVHPIATFSRKAGELDGILTSDATPNLMILYVGKNRPPLRVSPRKPLAVLARMSDRSQAWRTLDVSILQYAILEGLLGLTLERVTHGARIGYVHQADEAARRVDSGEFAAAFLLRPTPVSAVAAVASALEKMPPKSTFFYPKALTGMVIRQLQSP